MVPELQHFLEMVNQLGKFTPHLVHLTQPLRALLSKSTEWAWKPDQSEVFSRVKEEPSKPTLQLSMTVRHPPKSQHMLHYMAWGKYSCRKCRPVANASGSMTSTERYYAQIEKEALAITWACEKFVDYKLGKRITIETDHKPLVSLLTREQLDSLLPWVLWFRLCIDRFTYCIHHVSGKNLNTAYTLSWTTLTSTNYDQDLEELAELLMSTLIEQLPASKELLEQYQQVEHSDATCSTLMEYCHNG